jgi:hypothetical protein
MATEHHHHGGDQPLNHETTDISLDGVTRLMVGFWIVLVIVSSLMYGAYRWLDRRATAADTSVQAIAAPAPTAEAHTFPLIEAPNTMEQTGRALAGPKLLTNEPAWLAGFRAEQRAALTSYGWVNKEAGAVRIPIARAKQLLVERGLGAAPAAEAAAQ